MWLKIVDGVSSAEVAESLEQSYGDSPFFTFAHAGEVEDIFSTFISDGGVILGEGDGVSAFDDVVGADEGCAGAVWDDGSYVIAYDGDLFNGYYFQVTVADGCSGFGWAEVVGPFCAG